MDDLAYPSRKMSGKSFALVFGDKIPDAGYAIDARSGRLYRNGELWGRVESLALDAFTTVVYVAYKKLTDDGKVVDTVLAWGDKQ